MTLIVAVMLNLPILKDYIDFIYHCTFFEITKFSKILSKLTFFRKFSKILSNFESIFEKSVNFESIFENFVISKKMSMVDEVTIREFPPVRKWFLGLTLRTKRITPF